MKHKKHVLLSSIYFIRIIKIFAVVVAFVIVVLCVKK